MLELIRCGGGIGGSGGGVGVRLGVHTLPLHTILAIGRNYQDHAKEQGLAPPEHIMVFTKNPSSACLTNDDIVIPKICQDPARGGDQVDFEGELAVIIGPGPTGLGARDVSRADALKHVLGYCVANDVSARWWQKTGGGGQFFRGKSFDSFCPLGPCVVESKDIANPGALRLCTRVNNELMQDASTSDMSFDVPMLISDLSQGMTLTPGTVILTGTPSGVGMARTPPRWLKHNDLVEVEIDRIGVLRNRVRSA